MSQVTFLGSFPQEPPPPSLPEVAFAGRSNVGKSSALNLLLGSVAARVSKTPGRTQALNLFDVDHAWIAVDLPGYGHARVAHGVREAWKGLIERYLAERETLRLLVLLVDVRLPAQDSDRQMIDALHAGTIPFVVLATKIDAIARTKRGNAVTVLARAHGLPAESVIPFSATDRIGREDLMAVIRGAVR
jgi:GTP-binding protein